jgi:hypothetical protein
MEHLWSQAGATGRNPSQMEEPKNGRNKPIGNRWQPTATVSERMVRRGSTVRVRQRALQNAGNPPLSVLKRPASRRTCAGHGAFRAETQSDELPSDSFALRRRALRATTSRPPGSRSTPTPRHVHMPNRSEAAIGIRSGKVRAERASDWCGDHADVLGRLVGLVAHDVPVTGVNERVIR